MILHIDMDAFYASVEQLDDPSLKGKCVIVGGQSNRGVVSAASYEARKFGIHSAMPIFQARQKCPQGIFVYPRMQRYKEISRKVMALLQTFSPLVETVSIDEAYLDISGTERLLGSAEDIGRQIKARIKDSIHLTCSVGIAPNRFLAKIASDMDKPDGLTIIPPESVDRFITTLPIRKVPGVGAKTHRQLATMGIRNLGDVCRWPQSKVYQRLGKYGQRLYELACGIDHTPVAPNSPHKSVSSEETLAVDTADKNLLWAYLLKHSEDVARQLRRQNVRAKTVTLKLQTSDFKIITRSKTLDRTTQSTNVIYTEARQLLQKYRLNHKVRLIGVGTSGLTITEAPVQQDLFASRSTQPEGWEKVDQTVDHIIEKFGRSAIRRGSLKKKPARK